MKKNIVLSMAVASLLGADSLDSAFKNAKVDGYIRAGYQYHDISGDKSYKSDSIGGKLHIKTAPISGITAGASFYTTNKISNNDGEGVSFFNSNNKSYSILGEAYLEGVFGNTTIKLGRQELDTPFADTDDIGMIPNTFEAGVLVNKDIKDTTLILAQVQKWAGVDTDKPEEFQKIYNDDSVQTFGAIYDGIEGLSLSGWFFNLKAKNSDDLDSISYLEATYGSSLNSVSYEVGLQYANQSHKNTKNSKIYGVTLSIDLQDSGLTFSGAYNKVQDNLASNGFGGGPFFTSMEHLTIDGMGDDAKATTYGIEWDASAVVSGLSFGYNTFEVKSHSKKATEDDFTISYNIKQNLNLTAIYSDIDDKINSEKFKNTRVFVNYSF